MKLKENEALLSFIEKATNNYATISDERKSVLISSRAIIKKALEADSKVNLVFICTHNSRRSVFGQVWAKIAAHYFNIKDVNTFSGGTEKTAVYKEVINSFKRLAIECSSNLEETNPQYKLKFDGDEEPIIAFSKVFDDASIPSSFIALMTCTDADENCPFIPQASNRISLSYKDPKYSDNTEEEATVYDSKSLEIATQLFFLFSEL